VFGWYFHVGEAHLHRYAAERDFMTTIASSWVSNDHARVDATLRGVKGKRLTYQTTRHQRDSMRRRSEARDRKTASGLGARSAATVAAVYNVVTLPMYSFDSP
jgi:hypothetical protein